MSFILENDWEMLIVPVNPDMIDRSLADCCYGMSSSMQ
jgi:hypothetical protein